MIANRGRGRIVGSSSFSQAVNYIVREGPEFERDHSPPLATWSQNVTSIETAALEMEATAAMSRAKEPLYHLMVSFDENETPTYEQAKAVLDTHLKHLGFEGLQYVAALQNDGIGGKYHLHAVINRVDAETHIARPIWHDFEKLRAACREAEIEHGFRVLENVKRDGLSAGARDFEYYQKRPSLERRVREEIGPAVREAIAQPGATWADLHRVCAAHEVRYEEVRRDNDKVLGGRFVGYDEAESVRARLAGVDMTHRKLIERLGPFEQSREAELSRSIDAQKAVRRAERLVMGARYVQDPSPLVERLTANNATFTEKTAKRLIETKVDDREQRAQILDRILDTSVKLVDDKGKNERYTTPTVLRAEKQLHDAVKGLREERRGGATERPASERLDEQQRRAYDYALADDSRLKVVTGVPGAGKTTLISEVAAAYREAGYNVRAVAVANSAVEVLRRETDVSARSVAKELYEWTRELPPHAHVKDERLGKRDLLIIDEVSTLGTAQGAELLREAHKRGATVLALGDDKQFQAVAHGSALTVMQRGAREPGIDMEKTRRQVLEWQRDTTEAVRRGDVRGAIGAYKDHGFVHETGTQAEARAALVERWGAIEASGVTCGIETYTNVERQAINALARQEWAAMGRLAGPDHVLETIDGKTPYAIGDRVVIRETIREAGLHNGSVGTVRGIENDTLQIQRTDGKVVAVDTRETPGVQHSYTSTEYREQGSTRYAELQVVTKHVNQRSLTVGMTRHTHEFGYVLQP